MKPVQFLVKTMPNFPNLNAKPKMTQIRSSSKSSKILLLSLLLVAVAIPLTKMDVGAQVGQSTREGEFDATRAVTCIFPCNDFIKMVFILTPLKSMKLCTTG